MDCVALRVKMSMSRSFSILRQTKGADHPFRLVGTIFNLGEVTETVTNLKFVLAFEISQVMTKFIGIHRVDSVLYFGHNSIGLHHKLE